MFSRMGDGVASAFGTAHAAAAAAVELQREMPATELRVRIVMHSGEIEVADHDDRGRAVNRTGRLMAIAHGGQILMSGATAALLPDREALDLGLHRLRDLTAPEHVFQLLDVSLPAEFPPVRALESYVTNLPVQRTPLVGRDRDGAAVVELVRDKQIVTLTGVGGVGKTRLALQVAADMVGEFDAVFLIELAPVADEANLVGAAAAALRLPPSAGPSIEALVASLAHQHTLIVLDNCEHVLDAATELVDELTSGCGRLRVVLTSRESLGVAGERVVVVRSLDVDRAAELLRDRAVDAGASTEDLSTTSVEDVCRRLDGIPLSIELARASERSWSGCGRGRPGGPVRAAHRR